VMTSIGSKVLEEFCLRVRSASETLN